MLQRMHRLSTLLLLLTITFLASSASAQRSDLVQLEPWPGQRVLMLLPLQLGPGWNADRGFGQLILPAAEHELQSALQRTGKFSVTQPHRFNPLLRRAVLEERLTEEQVLNLDENPTLENARETLSQFDFAQPPLIAEFFLEEVRSVVQGDRQSVTLQVTARLYELDGAAINNIVLTSDPIIRGRTSLDRVLLAGGNAFDQIAAQFVQPIADFPLPQVGAPLPPEPLPPLRPMPALPTGPAPELSGRPGGILPPGTTPVLPPAQPPLGVTVPEAAN